MIAFRDVVKRFGSQTAVDGLSMTIAEGEVVVLGEHFGIRITRIISRQLAAEPAA